jgi:hypothetical protein
MKKLAFPLIAIFFQIHLLAGELPPTEAKQIVAVKVVTAPKIDGKLDEPEWGFAASATDFVQNSPNPGKAASQTSDVRVLYDDAAIYIGATLHDLQPDSIFKQLSDRDEIGVTDWFGIIIDTYRDGNNGSGFFVTASGVQFDTRYSPSGGNGCNEVFCGDQNWDAVWDSKVSIGSEGWVVELKIPYAALRFPKTDEQQWNVNFARMVRRHREVSYWNEVKPEGNIFLQQSGRLSGIKDIKSPLRLSLTPYVAAYLEDFYDKTATDPHVFGRSLHGGMDVKYGINDAFTLDMTLIPDFGEARSDNKILNLSPFEVRFDENRPFFTEGVELFNKGGVFYSRRIGGRLLHRFDVYSQLKDGEEVIENPATADLINATKISGRTSKGLGIGFLNAVANKAEAVIRNAEGEERTIETNPLTNYNVMVFDQNLPNNSYATLLNTNVWRAGSEYEANVTATTFEIRNKANSFSVEGRAALSQKYFTDKTDLGHTASVNLGSTKGNLRWRAGYNEESVRYDINDLGILFAPNERNGWFNFNFNRFEPFGKFNQGGTGFYIEYSSLYNPGKFTGFGVNWWGWLVSKNFWSYELWTYHEPMNGRDYFEPRVFDWKTFYRTRKSNNFGFSMSTDYRKKLAFDVRGNFRKFENRGGFRLNLTLSPRLRLNDKLSLMGEIGSYNFYQEEGFATQLSPDEVIFAHRDNITVENALIANYSFNNRMNLSVRVRHYWSTVKNEEFYRLQSDGSLGASDFSADLDRNYNSFNIDAIYRWRFAPGSDLFIIWKNAIDGEDDVAHGLPGDYFSNVRERLFELPQSNSLSVKVIYFLDYQFFVKKHNG